MKELRAENSYIERVHQDELMETKILMFIGLGAILLAGLLYFSLGTGFSQGWAISLSAIGLLQLVIGFRLYDSTPKDSNDYLRLFFEHPSKFRAMEQQRSEQAMMTFESQKVVLLFIFCGAMAGLVLSGYVGFPAGICVGLLLQAIIMLIFNIAARLRIAEYYEWLDNIP
ncbi:MAG: hypothetical protein AAF828_01960 [Bacteroidota bacterium]